MAIDTHYILAFPFESYFVDKDTGLPLAGGSIQFFSDTSRTTPKQVYMLSGSPPNYTYVPIGSTVFLDATGIPTYLGQNITLYFLPYTDTNFTTIDLYFIQVFSSGGVLQFTREGIPNFAITPTPEQEFKNYIPNGQFYLHTDIPLAPPNQVGQVTQAVTDIAYGGWTFERPEGSSATDLVIFERQNSIILPPVNYPRYVVQITNVSPGIGDTFKDLRVKFNDVNKFASTAQSYTIAFTARSLSGGTIQVPLYLIKNFGTGGGASPQSQTLLTTFNITTLISVYNFNFIFGDNSTSTLGTDNTDFVQLALRLPTTGAFSIYFTDFCLAFGNIQLTSFPPTPNSEFSYESIAGFLDTPAYDSSNLYLPLILSPSGLTYDTTQIGKIVTAAYKTPGIGELACDGAQYETSSYSSDGIPYARLQAKIYDSTVNMPYFGTGENFFSAFIFSDQTDQVIINNNSAGPVTDAADGSAPTGFTFHTIHQGQSFDDQLCYIFDFDNQNIFAVQSISKGTVANPPSPGTTTFTLNEVRVGNTLVSPIVTVNVTEVASLASKYFQVSTALNNYYVWFKVDGSGTDPGPFAGYTGIEVDLNSVDNVFCAAEKIRQSMNGWQVTTVNTIVGSSVPASSFFTIDSTTQGYYVWYTKDGIGTDPLVATRIGIKVAILSTDTAAQVASKTMSAINNKYFAVPRVNGYFVRALDNGEEQDPTVNLRYSLVPGIIGDNIGTYENDNNQNHLHTYGSYTFAGDGTTTQTGVRGASANEATGLEGSYESVPKNIAFNFYIKY